MQLAVEWASPGEGLGRSWVPGQVEDMNGALPQRLTCREAAVVPHNGPAELIDAGVQSSLHVM
jgi:hypothetical protein